MLYGEILKKVSLRKESILDSLVKIYSEAGRLGMELVKKDIPKLQGELVMLYHDLIYDNLDSLKAELDEYDYNNLCEFYMKVEDAISGYGDLDFDELVDSGLLPDEVNLYVTDRVNFK